MRKDLEQQLVSRWPLWFDVNGDVRRTAMPFGFRCGDGWFNIVWQLCHSLEPLVRDLSPTLPAGERFEIKSVKQKLGSLRVYVSHHTSGIDALRDTAAQESLRTCEECGRAGVLRNEAGYLTVLCDECLGLRRREGPDEFFRSEDK